MSTKLYPDFSVTAENCENEPIHRPNGIQAHGYQLVIDPDNKRVSSISENLLNDSNTSKEQWWELSWAELLPLELSKMINHAIEHEPDPFLTQSTHWLNKNLCVLMHKHKNLLFVELEFADDYAEAAMDSYEGMEQFRIASAAAESLDELYGAAARTLKDISGYDRVMIYRFHDDWHGEVVGEALNKGLDPYLGLHYPASDIPAIARRLFLENEIRIISDIELHNSPLVYNHDIAKGYGLDMTYAHLRVSSPIHLEYLKNMGVQSTFTIAIKERGQLWGLFAFHHYNSRLLSFKARRVCQFLAESFALKFIHSRLDEKTEEKELRRKNERTLLTQLSQKHSLEQALLKEQVKLTDVVAADGVMLIDGGERYTTGYVPAHEHINAILAYLKKKRDSQLFFTEAMDELLGVSKEADDHIGGIMAFLLSEAKHTYILLFRKPILQTVSWGGNPEKALSADTNPKTGLLQLSPRTSFESWKQEIRHKSKPWNEQDVDSAERILDKIVHVILQSGGEIARLNEKLGLMREEMEEFVYIASHDMQEPLRSILNYVDLLSREEYINNPTSRTNFLSRISSSGSRLREMINELLQYSRIGRAGLFNKEWINLHEVISMVRQNLALSIQRNDCVITTDTLPDIYGSKIDMVRLFQNLISNSIKYRKDSVAPRVHISAQRESNAWRISIQDNGIGIDEQYHNLVFQMFQRLHDQRKYQGNGIGLTICHKIMQVHDGDIWFESTAGEGTTFHMTFNKPK